jgi:hypothetical protein
LLIAVPPVAHLNSSVNSWKHFPGQRRAGEIQLPSLGSAGEPGLEGVQQLGICTDLKEFWRIPARYSQRELLPNKNGMGEPLD